MKKIPERKLSELLVEMVNGDNIIKCRSVQIALCRSIFQQILVACNEREIAIAVQNCRCARFIGDNEVFITSKIKREPPQELPRSQAPQASAT